jgi:uncharacterized protein
MDNFYELEQLRFEWDPFKAKRNWQKHRVAFEEAAEVFLDPFYVMGNAAANGELRDFALGYSLSRMLLVVHVERDDRIRIISAREATPSEVRSYEQSQ